MGRPLRRIFMSLSIVLSVLMIIGVVGCSGQSSTPTIGRQPTRERQTATTQRATTITQSITGTTQRTSTKSERQLYAQRMFPILQNADNASNVVAKIADDVGSGEISLDEGAARMRTQRDVLTKLRDEATAIDPPIDIKSAHSHITTALKLEAQACNNFALGLERRDESLVNEGVNQMQAANSEISQAQDDLSKVPEARELMIPRILPNVKLRLP